MPLINHSIIKRTILSIAEDEGFVNPRILSPFTLDSVPGIESSPSLLVVALPYGNDLENNDDEADCPHAGRIAPFARRNYYREAVKRLKNISLKIRQQYGGEKSSFRIFCNSRISEKPLAEQSGLGCIGKNSLIITKTAGSLVILAAMTLPFPLETDKAEPKRFEMCRACNNENPPCKAACPTGAVIGDGNINLKKCIQWYASGNGSKTESQSTPPIPQEVLTHWGKRLYGCSNCQDACPHNRRAIHGVKTEEGTLPAYIDAEKILNMNDEEIKSFFKGTAMGLSWLGPKNIRRNASIISSGNFPELLPQSNS
jgi:epoxyqueuosine reductase